MKAFNFVRSHIFIFPFFILLLACNSDKRNWEKAQKINTMDAYESFTINYPESAFIQDAINAKTNLVRLADIDKSITNLKLDVYGIPSKILAKDSTVLCRFIRESAWITGLKAYFYIIYKGENAHVPLKFNYSDNYGSKDTLILKPFLRKSTKYVFQVELKFNSNVAGNLSSHNCMNKIEITFANKVLDQLSVAIPSWQGHIADVKFVKIE